MAEPKFTRVQLKSGAKVTVPTGAVTSEMKKLAGEPAVDRRGAPLVAEYPDAGPKKSAARSTTTAEENR